MGPAPTTLNYLLQVSMTGCVCSLLSLSLRWERGRKQPPPYSCPTAQTLTALVSLCAPLSLIDGNKIIQPQFCCLWFPSPGFGQPPTQPGCILPLGTRCPGLRGLWAAEGGFVLQPEEETGTCPLPRAVGTERAGRAVWVIPSVTAVGWAQAAAQGTDFHPGNC